MSEVKENVKRISHDKWSAMFERIMNNDHPLRNWYPTIADAMEIAKDPVKNYEFIIWILYSNDERELSEEEQEVEAYLENVLKEHTEYTDN